MFLQAVIFELSLFVNVLGAVLYFFGAEWGLWAVIAGRVLLGVGSGDAHSPTPISVLIFTFSFYMSYRCFSSFDCAQIYACYANWLPFLCCLCSSLSVPYVWCVLQALWALLEPSSLRIHQ